MRGYGNKNLVICFHKKKHSSIYNIIVRRKRTDSNSTLDSLGRLSFSNTNNVAYLFLKTKKFQHYLHMGGITITVAVGKILGIDISTLKHISKKRKSKCLNQNY